MKRCKHCRGGCYTPHVFDEISGLYVDTIECAVCDAYLPLGPAADDSPEVQIEIRAAELAADVADASYPTIIHTVDDGGCVGCGWDALGYDTQGPDYDAGYLARLIYEHKEEA